MAARDPVLSLQRQVGNRATARLLQREPSHASRLAKAAKQLGVQIDERDIHLAMRVREGEDDGVRPGLNVVANLGPRGRTGFVDPSGRYLGDFLKATRDGALPAGVAIMIGPLPFADGDDGLLATLRHELAHAEHDNMLLGWLGRWRTAGKGSLDAWMRRQKASPVELALVGAGTTRKGVDTELLAHIEGFAAVFERTPPPSPAVILKASMPPAIEQLHGAAERGWTGIDAAVKAAAEKRLTAFYEGLDASRQILLRDWLFYLRYRAGTRWPKDAADQDAKSAGPVWQAFHPHTAFLDWLLGIVAKSESRAHPLPEPSNRNPVTEVRRSAPAATVKLGAGKVRAYVDVGYRFGGESRSHGISLSYDGPEASQMRWLQFIWREVVPDRGSPAAGTLYHQGAAYPLTTNPSEPSQVGWNTDTATYLGGPQAAFYELDNATNRSAGKLEIFDEPSAPATDVHAAFVARAHLVQYLVKGASVLFRAEFEIEHTFAQPTDRPSAKPRLVSAAPAAAIDPGPRARLHAQFKELDYLP